MQTDSKKYPRTGDSCYECNTKVIRKNMKDFTTVLKKDSPQNYTCYCLRCLNSVEPELLLTKLSPQQLTKHPEQFIQQIKDEIDYPQEEEDSKSKTTNYESQLQAGYQMICKQHDEILNLWNTKTNQLACIKCALHGNSIKIGDGNFIFLEQEVSNAIQKVNTQIAEMDRAIAHYKEQQELIQKAKQYQQKKDAECKEQIVKFIETKCKKQMDGYINRKKAQLDKHDSKIGDYSEEIEARGRILRDRGNSIMQFAKNFKDKSALYLKMEPMNLFKEDVQFWSAVNKNWDSKNFDWSYKNPSFQFEDPEKVAQDIFEIKYVKSDKDLEIVDFKN